MQCNHSIILSSIIFACAIYTISREGLHSVRKWGDGEERRDITCNFCNKTLQFSLFCQCEWGGGRHSERKAGDWKKERKKEGESDTGREGEREEIKRKQVEHKSDKQIQKHRTIEK